ncbi:M15 family metallopeptidase [Flectobacillus longus]|uniref:M15 family metallopeptidase n=1 Tax=Flectobacillus longus TaxID=2984207 RepID=UPI0024B6B8EB|nr:M15 family metallopeptidase [Flectobacillus longus]MDI9878206.1 M15 family metallopeptidase [Flectobacillus longus]
MLRFFKLLLPLLSLSLLACSFLKDSVEDATWQDLGCDTTQKVSTLAIYDMVQPFYETDTFLQLNIKPTAIYVATVGLRQEIKMTGYKLDSLNQPMEIPNIAGTSGITSTWIEQAYLGALIYTPRYLYDRWTRMLENDRATFLAKRDSIKTIMAEKHSSIKVISDLRSIANQRKYLSRKRTASPVSMHNFGLAADFAIFRGRRISNTLSSYKPLDTLTAQYGLTWGGNFVGFMDPGHIQYFKNGATLVQKYPVLRFEFEPYRDFYLSTVEKAVKSGKINRVVDTADLLSLLNELRRNQPCSCGKVAKKINLNTLEKIKGILKSTSYNAQNDIVIIGDLEDQTLSLVTSKGIITLELGKWR